MRKTFLSLFIAALFASTAANAAETTAAPEAAPAPAAQAAAPQAPAVDTDLSAIRGSVFGAADTITKEYDAWLRKGEQKTREGCRRHNRDLQSMECQLRKLVIYGDAPVAGSPRDPDWISNRANAFAEAQLLAYQKFAQAQSLTHQYEFLRRYVNDTTPLPEEPQRAQTQLGAMMDKVLALGSAYLDKFLRELDVDPALYEQLPKEQRKPVLQHLLQQKSRTEARAELSGLFPLTNFTAMDASGRYTVRVVLSRAPSRIEVAKLILRKGERIAADPAKRNPLTLYERYADASEAELFSSFGPRLVWDEHGYPALLSFGQSDVQTAADPTEQAYLLQGAQSRAYDNALNYLTQILNGQVSSKIQIQDGNEYLQEQVKTYQKDGSVADSVIKTSARRLKQEEEQTLRAKLTNFAGIEEFKTWNYVDPVSRRPVVGCVLIWTPETARTAAEVKDIQTRPIPAESAQAPAAAPAAGADQQPLTPSTTKSIETDDFEF